MNSVCAILLRSGAVLIARRSPGGRDAGFWEFPRGRIEKGESAVLALARALREKLGIIAEIGVEAAPGALSVSRFSGTPSLQGQDHDKIAWVPANRLLEYDFVASDIEITRVVAAYRRRQRYKGTHPRRFEEKYKELNADPEAVAKAKARGSTPAGTHLPIMVEEVARALEPLAGAAILDCTLGWGGHAAELARRAGPEGTVIALDRDGEELSRTRRRLDAAGIKITARQSNYAGARQVLRELGLSGVDALLADLGVSSMQLDRPERGMSFKMDGPLDMRMDRSKGKTAAEWIAGAVEKDIERALIDFGDEPDAKAIAAALASASAQGRSPKTTRELSKVVGAAKNLEEGWFRKKNAFSSHPAARTFQALRIAVNEERGALAQLMENLPFLMRPGGRAALLTFHSGEEALVEDALRRQTAAGLWRTPLAGPLKPLPEEVRENPRSRSARLWRAVRV